MPHDPEHQTDILNILENFHGIEPLRKLFWTELNYDHENTALPYQDKNNDLASAPVLWVTGGGHTTMRCSSSIGACSSTSSSAEAGLTTMPSFCGHFGRAIRRQTNPPIRLWIGGLTSYSLRHLIRISTVDIASSPTKSEKHWR